MFSNLVRIEVIRLFKSTILKISAAIAMFLLLFIMLVFDAMVELTGNIDISVEGIRDMSYRVLVFEGMFGSLVAVVLGLTVAFTTCNYHKYRLAINIEGAVRSRLKLCLAEICGIAIFVAAINLLIFPALAIVLAGHPESIVMTFFSGNNEVYVIYVSSFAACMFTSLTTYLLSQIIHKVPFAVALSILMSILGMFLSVYSSGFAHGYYDTCGKFAGLIEDIGGFAGLLLPIIIISVIAAVRNRKADRI